MLAAWRRTARAVEPVRGSVPLSAWKAIVASAKMSVAGVQGTGCACSGAM